MKKEDFLKLGLDEDIASKCAVEVEKQLKDVVPYARFKAMVDEKNELKDQIKDRDTQLENIKNSDSNIEDLKTEISKLQKENKKKDDEYQSNIKKLKTESAIEKAISKAKGKNPKAIKALLELGEIEFDETDSIKGLSDKIASIKESDSYLFDSKEDKASFKGTKPGESKEKNEGLTKEMFKSMDYRQRAKLHKEDKDTYKRLTKDEE